MRRFFVAVVFLLTAAIPLLAQDTKTYEDMTLAELEAVNTKSLTREEKRLYKSALNAAKKAEKERIKAEKKRLRAEKKAEKKRLAAEKRRIKAEIKAAKKHNKPIEKKLRLIAKTYENTSIDEDDFEAYITATGPYASQFPTLFGAGDSSVPRRHWLEAHYYPDDERLIFRLFISNLVRVDELDYETIKEIRGKPERYVARQRYWDNYNQAALKGGTRRTVMPVRKYLDTCSTLYCSFRETFYVELEFDDLIKAEAFSPIFKIKVSNQTGKYFIEEVETAYIVGFIKRMSDISPEWQVVRKGTDAIEEGLRSILKPIPTYD